MTAGWVQPQSDRSTHIVFMGPGECLLIMAMARSAMTGSTISTWLPGAWESTRYLNKLRLVAVE